MNIRMRPKNDFVFKKLFGEQETVESLIALLNAILQLEGSNRIVQLTVIENLELSKERIDDKTGILDVRVETENGVQIDIEMQVSKQEYMPRRTLFYLSKLFTASIKSGDEYQNLKRTITINILDFNLFEIARFHSTFHFYEDHEEKFMLTDVMEAHFIEYPKFAAAAKNLNNPLHRWLLFLDEGLSENQLKELTDMDPIIAKTEKRLEWLSSDEETLRLYKAREHSLLERNSLIAEAKAEGKVEGKVEGRAEIALNMLRKGMDLALITEVTGLSTEEINRIIKSES